MITVAQLKQTLADNPDHAVRFVLPDGRFIPEHFHITEVGHVTKDFVDCGGTRRSSSACVLQTLVAHDVDHRLGSDKFSKILALTAKVLPDESLPVEIEYDEGTVAQFAIGSAAVSAGAVQLLLESKHTACLAPDKCGLEDLPQPGRAQYLASSRPDPSCDPAANC